MAQIIHTIKIEFIEIYFYTNLCITYFLLLLLKVSITQHQTCNKQQNVLNLNNIKFKSMKKITYLLFVCICLTGCKQCKKKQPEPDKGYSSPVNTDLYDYAYFKPGTYWVYQDSISGILDSVYIIYANNGVYTNGDTEVEQGYYRGTFYWFKCDAISSYDHYKYENWMDQSWEVNGSVPVVNREKFIMPGSGFNFGQTIHTAITYIGKTLYVSLDHVTYQNYYNVFSVKTQTFASTQKWTNYGSNCDDNQNTNYYIAKNIGIVRREQLDSNRTWNLIRYHIIQ